MATITLPNGRLDSDIRLHVSLKDGEMNVDWAGVQNIRAYMYSDEQKAIAGSCDIHAIDGTDLVVDYPASRPQYPGVNRVIVRCFYSGRQKTYDKPAINLVPRTADQAGAQVVLDAPEVSVEINVDEVSTSLLDEAISAAVKAAAAAQGIADAHVGPAAGFGIISASVDENVGTPDVEVVATGDDQEKNIHFDFFNLKGGKGDKGDRGPAGVESVNIAVDQTIGTPSAEASVENGVMTIAISGIKGEKGDQGNSGYQGAASELEVVNNDTQGGESSAWAAERGKIVRADLDENVALLRRGLERTAEPAMTTVSNLQLAATSKYKATQSASLKVKYFSALKGDIIRITGTNGTSANLRYALSTEVPAADVAVDRETLLSGTSLNAFFEVPYDCYFGIYTTAFSDLRVTINEKTVMGTELSLDTSNVKLMLNALGITGCEEVKYVKWTPGFVYYDDGTTASSDVLEYTTRRPTNGKKYLFYAQNVSTGTGRAGLAFYDANGDYVSGVRQVTGASANGLRVAVAEIPSDAAYFRATLNNDSVSGWFGYLTDNEKILQYQEPANNDLDTSREDIKYTMRLLGITDYSQIVPGGWYDGKFVYYDNGQTANSSSLSYTYKCLTGGKKYLVFTQNVSTGTGRAGLAFYNEDNEYISGVRQFVGAAANGYRLLAVEIPDGTSYFRATINTDSKGSWFGYLSDDENVLKYANISEEKYLHLKICLLGNSYTADAWRYVPAMLLAYGITCEVNFYYRGSGSLADLDDQWTHDSQYDPSNWDGSQHIRLHFKIDSRKGVAWSNATRTSAQAIVAADKYDIISIQQAGKQCKTPSYWVPYLQNVIDKIMAECDYPFTLCLFEAYTSADDTQHEASLLNQKEFFKKYPFTMLIPAAAAVFSAQENETLAALGDSSYHKMYASDNTHMQEGLPCYITALTVVQSILDKYMPGKSVLNDRFRATAENIANLGMDATANGESTGVTESNCYLAQKAAICATKNPFEIIVP